jgi:serine/threonine protein kinase
LGGCPLRAIKVLSKFNVTRYKKEESVVRERDILLTLRGHPFVVNLYETFQVSFRGV